MSTETGRTMEALASQVLATARDHEKRIYGGSGVPGPEGLAFLREVKELAVDVIRTHTSTGCWAGMDGECDWSGCPQERDSEPLATGRHCPLDNGDPEDQR